MCGTRCPFAPDPHCAGSAQRLQARGGTHFCVALQDACAAWSVARRLADMQTETDKKQQQIISISYLRRDGGQGEVTEGYFAKRAGGLLYRHVHTAHMFFYACVRLPVSMCVLVDVCTNVNAFFSTMYLCSCASLDARTKLQHSCVHVRSA